VTVGWLRQAPQGVLIDVYAQPGGRRTEILGVHDGALKIRVNAPPVDGKANAMLIEFIAVQCQVPKRSLTLVSGDSSRRKVIQIMGGDMAEIQKQLFK
jgi:uncharacterized protein